MGSDAGFPLFGPSHLAGLAVVGGAALAAAIAGRRWRPRAPPALRWPLGALVLAQFLVWYTLLGMPQGFSSARDLPLHLCDLNQLLLVVYLWRPRSALFDLLYYWILAASSLALLLPDLQQGFPATAYLALFGSHGLTLVIMVHLAFGRGRGPTPGRAAWAWGWMLGYGILLVPVNMLLGSNYLYLFDLPALPAPLAALTPPAPWHWPLLAGFMYLVLRGLQAIAPAPASWPGSLSPRAD